MIFLLGGVARILDELAIVGRADDRRIASSLEVLVGHGVGCSWGCELAGRKRVMVVVWVCELALGGWGVIFNIHDAHGIG
jgi:hypothetical protein